MKVSHKHAEVIKAWADGAEIQWYDDSPREHRWKDCPISFIWDVRFQFRVKPEPKPDVVYYGVFDMDGSASIESCFTKFKDQGDQIMLTFDGETGRLKAVEIL